MVQDKPDSKRMPGWYTGYVRDIYQKKGNIEKIEKSANHLFDKRVQCTCLSDEASCGFQNPVYQLLDREASSPSERSK